MKSTLRIILTVLGLLLLPAAGFAGPDDFIGDTAIYGGETATVKPNVLIIFDTSGSMGEQVDIEVCEPDTDQDGIADKDDNCPAVSNPGQEDSDGDGVGDACLDPTADLDNDGIPNQDDNCVATANADQADEDNDGIGDVCDVNKGDYDPNVDYADLYGSQWCGNYDKVWEEGCSRNAIYICKDFDNGVCAEWEKTIDDYTAWKNDSDIKHDHDCADPIDALDAKNVYQGNTKLRKNRCSENSGNNNNDRLYAFGNYVIWYNATGGGGGNASIDQTNDETLLAALDNAAATSRPSANPGMICTTQHETKNTIARNVVGDLIRSTSGVNFGLMRFNGNNGGRLVTDNVLGGNSYTTSIKDMLAPFPTSTSTTTNRDALLEIVGKLPASGNTPLAETLYEAKQYLIGGASEYYTGSYTSPINASCQQNYIILMTDGMPTYDGDGAVNDICNNGDCDGDGNEAHGEDYLDDMAKFLYTTDLSATYGGTQNAWTFPIGFGQIGADADAVQLLQDTADNGQGRPAGQGKAYLASDYQDLTAALTSIIGQILEVNTAFVAPVVPTNPENRVQSGKRVYLGFFKPIMNSPWYGNIKKFGFIEVPDANGKKETVIADQNGVAATDANGKFLPTAQSYWSSSADGANVSEGGVGAVLTSRDLTTDPRNIYFYNTLTANPDLTHVNNTFATNKVAPDKLGLAATATDARDNIVNYIKGFDAFDADLDGNITEQRDWLLGDILHSKPAIQSYNNFSLADETDVTANKTYIFVGSNDGQLHCFRDADGLEMWSFVPPAIMPDLQFLANNIHNYYMDGSPILHVHDHDRDGNLGPEESSDGDSDDGSNDKVIMLVGMRRGGGVDTLDATSSRGFYYALDISDPLTPKYVGAIDMNTTNFEELGETWSDPVIGKLRLGGTDRLVAIFGAGYDNNEDLRFGGNQKFPDDTSTNPETTIIASATVTNSTGTSAPYLPRGRGIYIMQLGSFDSSGALTTGTTSHVWSYTYDAARTADNPTYSFPTNIAAADTNFDGYIDRLYAGDTGGNLWRFNIRDTSNTANWKAAKIFSTNPGADGSNGRKIMYEPSVVLENQFAAIYFGTGDRAHPLNEGVTDRIYAVYDYYSDLVASPTVTYTEDDLVDVTEDYLQAANPDADPTGSCTATDNSIKCIKKRLFDYNASDDGYRTQGWYIKLNQDSGEKVLSKPLVYNKVAYFTTYSPNVNTTDPCLSGNLGVGRAYALDYRTGEAVFNYAVGNDSEFVSEAAAATSGTYFNDRAYLRNAAGDVVDNVVLRRADRVLTMSAGIPSGAVLAGDKVLIGSGGGAQVIETKPGGGTLPIYWLWTR